MNYDEDQSDYMYYQYNAELADYLDEAEDNSDTSDMIQFMYPIMEKAAKYVAPVFKAMNGMIGNAWNKFAESVGIRRRMEDGDEYNAVYNDYDDDEEEEEGDEVDVI